MSSHSSYGEATVFMSYASPILVPEKHLPSVAAAFSQPTREPQNGTCKRGEFGMPKLLHALRARDESTAAPRRRPNVITRSSNKERNNKAGQKSVAASPTITTTGSTPTTTPKIPRPKIPSDSPPADTHRNSITKTALISVAAENALDDFEIPLAISLYLTVPQTPQIMFNIAQLHLLILDRDTAREYLEQAVAMDNWFAVGWFQLGYLEFVEARYERAVKAYSESLSCMRRGRSITYQQVGLAYTITFTAILWGRAAAQRAIYDGVYKAGERPQSVPVGAIFRVDGRLARTSTTMNAGEITSNPLVPAMARGIVHRVYERV
jgi:hypothetical protein